MRRDFAPHSTPRHAMDSAEGDFMRLYSEYSE
jgi:hypothetical protein